MTGHVDPTAFVHRLALVEGSVVGARSKVWQFASVIRGAVIGADCNIASGACIDGSTIGDRTKIAHNLAMGPGFVVGNDCFIAPNVTFANDLWPRAHVSGFDIRAYQDRPAIIMDDGASIGANAVILPGVRIGAFAMVAAGSVVTRDVPAGHLWKGCGEISEIEGEDKKRRARHAGDMTDSRAFLAARGFTL
jgi:acetyltransferase-like isoleucine patch superfamily enzyme